MIALLLAAFAMAGLTLEQVLDASEQSAPLVSARAKADEALGKSLAARGAFDPVLTAHGGAYVGEYPRQVTGLGLSAESGWGPELQLGLQQGVGEFPSYDGRDAAPAEWVARVELPLDQLGMSKAWVERGSRLAEAQQQGALAEWKGVRLRFDAGSAYWKWVAAAESLRVARNLLELADTRGAALARQVEEGLVAELDQVDNDRVRATRRAEVAKADGQVEAAAAKLRLYLGQDSPRLDVEEAPNLGSQALMLGAPTTRPDRLAADAQRTAAEWTLRGARRGVLPDVKVYAQVEQPIDGSAPDALLGAAVELPLALRKDRGGLQAAAARLQRAEADQLWVQQQAEAQQASAIALLAAAKKSAVAAIAAERQAAKALRMEIVAVRLGGADRFELLLREDLLAKARKARIDAQLSARMAELQLAAAEGRL